MISRYAPDPAIEGQRLSDLATRAGVAPEEYALRLLDKGDASLVSFNMSEDDIEHIMRQPWTMTCTDGDLVPLGLGKPHPRAYGAFPRKLKRYVRERGAIELAHAIRTMTSLPASVFGLKDRGQLRVGAVADLLVFDLAGIDDVATYQEPHQLAAGMTDILVNGQWARRDGAFTTTMAGRVVVPDRR
jgi:N-acyl-D-aspartate/D-glutamate deacylase